LLLSHPALITFKPIKKGGTMKKYIVAALLLTGCFDSSEDAAGPSTKIRFQAIGISVNYGIGVCDARHIGYIADGSATEYHNVSPGTCAIQIYTGSAWLSDTVQATLTAGHNYTLMIIGPPESYTYSLATDQ
jgi:hypothetical protein